MPTHSNGMFGGLRAGLMMTALALAGCKGTRDALINHATDQPDFKKKIIDSGRTSCEKAWQKKLPNQSAELDHTMHAFCDCIAVKTTETYSNAELLDLGLKGMESKTPEQKAKTAANIKACEAQANIPAS